MSDGTIDGHFLISHRWQLVQEERIVGKVGIGKCGRVAHVGVPLNGIQAVVFCHEAYDNRVVRQVERLQLVVAQPKVSQVDQRQRVDGLQFVVVGQQLPQLHTAGNGDRRELVALAEQRRQPRHAAHVAEGRELVVGTHERRDVAGTAQPDGRQLVVGHIVVFHLRAAHRERAELVALAVERHQFLAVRKVELCQLVVRAIEAAQRTHDARHVEFGQLVVGQVERGDVLLAAQRERCAFHGELLRLARGHDFFFRAVAPRQREGHSIVHGDCQLVAYGLRRLHPDASGLCSCR